MPCYCMKLSKEELKIIKVKPDRVLDTGCYPVKVLVFTSKKKYQKYLKVFNNTEPLDDLIAEASVQELQKKWFSLYLPTQDICTVVHECLHMAWFVLDYVGVEIDQDNHEALAYLQEHLVKQLQDK